MITKAELARLIDHTILKPEATSKDVQRVASDALESGCAAACVNPGRIQLISPILQGSMTKSCSVIGFPFGSTPTEVKVAEVKRVVELGANEFDMVINFGLLKDGDYSDVERDVSSVRRAVGAHGILKVILETSVLSDDEIVTACRISEQAGADFIKTSTGYHPAGGATAHAVELMRATVPNLGVKASGGIRDLETALLMIEAGATRLGMSATMSVLQDL